MINVHFGVILEKPLLPCSRHVSDLEDRFRVNDKVSVGLEPLDIYEKEDEIDPGRKGDEIRALFQVIDSSGNEIYYDIAPHYIIACGNPDITEKNRSRQQEALTSFIEEFFERVTADLKESEEKTFHLKSLLGG